MGGTKAATAAITTTTATIVHAGGGVQFTSARLDRVFSNPMPPPAGVEQDRLLPVEEALAARDGPPSSAARQAAAALGPRSKPSSSTVSPLRPPPAAPASTSTARSTRPSASADTGGEIRVMRDSSDSTSSIEPIATMFQQYIREQYGPSRRDSTPRQGRTSPAVPSPSGQWDQHNTVDLSGPATGDAPARLPAPQDKGKRPLAGPGTAGPSPKRPRQSLPVGPKSPFLKSRVSRASMPTAATTRDGGPHASDSISLWSIPSTSSSRSSSSTRRGSNAHKDPRPHTPVLSRVELRRDWLRDARRPARRQDAETDDHTDSDFDDSMTSWSDSSPVVTDVPAPAPQWLDGSPAAAAEPRDAPTDPGSRPPPRTRDARVGSLTEAAASRTVDETNPLRFCVDRPYGEWIGEIHGKRERVPGAGALFPRGYEPSLGQAKPWTCPVEGCTARFPLAWGLGGHFSMAHRALLLHDTGNGSLTVVGRRTIPNPDGRLPAVVVSAAFDTNEGRSAAATTATTNAKTPAPKPTKPAAHGAGTTTAGSSASTTSSSSLSSSSAVGTHMYQAAAESELWHHLLPHLGGRSQDPPRANPAAIELLATFPRRRDLPARLAATYRDLPLRADAPEFLAVLLYLTGDRGLCNNCCTASDADDALPFGAECVALPSSASPRLKSALGAWTCCNCYLLRPRNRPCVMVRSAAGASASELAAAAGPPSEPAPTSSKAKERAAANRASASAGYEKRRSSRLVEKTPAAAVAATRTPTVGGETSTTPRSESPNKMISPAAAGALARAGAGVSLAASLEVEDWEFAPGRIRDESKEEPENIAFSTAFLSQNLTVTVAPDVTFRIEMIKPGTSSRLGVVEPPGRLRICSVASGKVRVRLGTHDQQKQQQQQFAVGANGMFKVAGGVECVVENRYYLDAVLHITSLPVEA